MLLRNNIATATPTVSCVGFVSLFQQVVPLVPRVPEYHYLPEPNLDDITPTQDLLLFREAQRKMKEELVC